VGVIIVVVSIVLMIWGITTTTAIHNHNMEDPDQAKSDLFSIIVGIFGALAVIVGFVLIIQPPKKPGTT
jgi:hypothetical protein